ncbi:autotransporter outer membrane beta-barrel domain-containing protein [Pseudomonas sp. NPDC089569]|uniref:autotransporter outer membrane beta-barrel domain-containing protein n=1 Tax=Pseudomonas sp. NPDC089569 TaxID=3390722 RepID=UPI003D06AADB
MNKAFRIIWSHARSAFVVVDELASAGGKRSTGEKLLVALGLSVVASSAQATAGCGYVPITSSNSMTSTCNLTWGTNSLTVAQGGSIAASTGPGVNSSSGFGTVSNAGSITSGNDYAISLHAIEGESGTSLINLSGATIRGIGGINLGYQGTGVMSIGSITNAGTIDGTSNVGMLLYKAALTDNLTNSGTITSTGSDGLFLINSTIAGKVINQAGGVINGGGSVANSNSGIHLETGGAITGGVDNAGTISGRYAGISLHLGEGGTEPVMGGVRNSGTISGDLYSIYVDNLANAGAIDISGTNAHLIGDVYATNSDVSVKSGAVFANENAYVVKSFTVEQGATLNMGVGNSTSEFANGITVSNGFTNNGVVSLASGVTGTIHGDYTQSTNGVLKLGVADDANFGKLVVAGTANLASNAKIDVDVTDPNHTFTSSSLQHVLSATTLNSDGTFHVTDNSILFDFGAVKDGNNVNLTLTAAAPTPPITTAPPTSTPDPVTSSTVVQSVNNNGNHPGHGAAVVLDQVITSNPNGELAGKFVSLTTEQQVSEAVTQTLPLMTGGASGATTSALSSINNVVQARQDSNSGLSGGDLTSDNHAWIKTFGSWADQDDNKGVSGFDANTTGLAIGTDAAFTEQLRLGVAFAYARTDVDSNSSIARQSLDVDTYQLIGYGSYSLQPDTEVNFQVDVGQHNNDGKRQIAFASSTAKADYNSQSAHIGVGLGHALHFSEQLTFLPSVRADYTWIGDEGYHEKGAGALDLDVDRNDAEQFILSVDGKLNYNLNEHTQLSANLGAGYDLINEQSSITSAYAGASTAAFTTRGLDPSPWLERGGLGLTHTLDNGTEVSLRYDVESRTDFLNQSAALKVRWAF